MLSSNRLLTRRLSSFYNSLSILLACACFQSMRDLINRTSSKNSSLSLGVSRHLISLCSTTITSCTLLIFEIQVLWCKLHVSDPYLIINIYSNITHQKVCTALFLILCSIGQACRQSLNSMVRYLNSSTCIVALPPALLFYRNVCETNSGAHKHTLMNLCGELPAFGVSSRESFQCNWIQPNLHWASALLYSSEAGRHRASSRCNKFDCIDCCVYWRPRCIVVRDEVDNGDAMLVLQLQASRGHVIDCWCGHRERDWGNLLRTVTWYAA